MTLIRSRTDEPMMAVAIVLDRLERAWYPELMWKSDDLHVYVPWELNSFIRALTVAIDATPGRSYLEIGCGIGTKMAIVAQMGFEVYGIEIRPQYIAIAHHLCPEATIVQADASGWDEYGRFDLIYSYRPFIQDSRQDEFDRYQTECIRSGSILISPGRDLSWGPWESLAPDVWRRM